MDAADDLDQVLPSTAVFPLPYRVLFLAGLGILGWATNLHGLDRLNIDVLAVMDLSTSSDYKNVPNSPLIQHRTHGNGYRVVQGLASAAYLPVYRLCATYFGFYTLSWCLFYYFTKGGDVTLVDIFGYIPGVTALLFLVVLICPCEIFQKHERDMFLHSIYRCITATAKTGVHFADVIFADVFTSFAKVLGDLWLSLVMLSSDGTLLVIPASEPWSRWVAPLIMSLPYLTRFKQCIAEYTSPYNTSRRPLYNALKYATAFPVLGLSAAQNVVLSDLATSMEPSGKTGHPLFRLWLVAVFINSSYSFWWDVTNDWGLDLLTRKASVSKSAPPRPLVLPLLHSRSSSPTGKSTSSPTERSHRLSTGAYPWGLRPTLLYPLPVYPLCIFLNFVLRMTWSIKLSSHLHSHVDGSVVIFWLEVAEVVRRWIWVFLRVEWEVIKDLRDAGPSTDYGEEEFELSRTSSDQEILNRRRRSTIRESDV